MKSPVKAVLFDLYETLVTQAGTPVPRAGRLGELLGLDASAYRREWKQLRPLVLRGELTFQKALGEIGTRLGVAIPMERVARARDERIRANTLVFQKIDRELAALIADLRAGGMRLATISNCMAEDVVAWPDSPFAPHFGAAVFSFEAGVMKPDQRIYLEAVRRLGVDPEDAVYVGDGGDDELAGAGRAGLRAAQAAWFVSREPLPGIPVLGRYNDVRRLALE